MNPPAADTLRADWMTGTLADFVKPISDRVKPGEHPAKPFIGMDAVEAQTMKLLGTVPAATMKSSAVRFRPGQVLYGRLRPYLNKVFAPDFEGLASAEFICLQPKDGGHPKLIQYRLNSLDFVRFASRINEGDRPRVDFDQISGFPIRLPPPSQQEPLVEALDSYFSRLDEVEALLERVQRNLKRYRASVLQAAVTGRLVPTEAELARGEGREYEPASELLKRVLAERRRRWEESGHRGKYEEPAPPDTSNLRDLPEGWCWATLAQLCNAIGDVDHKMPRGVPHGLPYVSPKDFLPGNRIDLSHAKRISDVDFKRLSRKIRPEHGDILLSRYGTVGEVRLIETDHPLQASYSIAILKLVDQGLSRYLLWALRSEACQSVMRSAIRASAQPDLGLASIRQIPVPVPPSVEMERVVDTIERAASVVDDLENSESALRLRMGRLRQSILQSAFTGKLTDRVAIDEMKGERVLRSARA